MEDAKPITQNDDVQIQASTTLGTLGLRASIRVAVFATVAWVFLTRSDLPLLTLCSDVLLILIVTQFVYSKIDKRQRSLPELVFSEEMVNTVAASFRVRTNRCLLMAHDIILGRDFLLFIKIVVCLWILSAIGSYYSLFTIAYAGILLAVSLPAIYKKYEEPFGEYCCKIQRKFSQQFRIVDEGIRRSFSDKDD